MDGLKILFSLLVETLKNCVQLDLQNYQPILQQF